MKELIVKSFIRQCEISELDAEEQQLVNSAIEGTSRSYAKYSHFHVGAAVLLDNGVEIIGCNQENAAFTVGLCAERSALYAAGSQYPDVPVKAIAIAARNSEGELTDEPISPCGSCRQVIIETEVRFQKELKILLYGKKKIYVISGIKNLMPLSFTEF